MKKPSINPLSPSIFREAARAIAQEENYYACCALDYTSLSLGIPLRDGDSPACLRFAKVLKPEGKSDYAAWYGTPYEPANQMARTLGLLLCVELIKDEAALFET